jgi:hypothetical protein
MDGYAEVETLAGGLVRVRFDPQHDVDVREEQRRIEQEIEQKKSESNE